ncbi:hypothetical protein [Phormidium sp. CCY1219]|uniref:hypothetical protein n=1 Tax=Phormidium sp. CCY1219 TaxID=2886104 RepID=UPI002D1EE434|nr:hypothetical protein [Phormidium sp. CCY1219]MEB3826424.1 hypothetical protein [Phormidium sp. CCY1219]
MFAGWVDLRKCYSHRENHHPKSGQSSKSPSLDRAAIANKIKSFDNRTQLTGTYPMGTERWLFLLGFALLLAFGGAWGLVVVEIDAFSAVVEDAFRVGVEDAFSAKVALSLPVGLVVFWPIAQHLAKGPFGSGGPRRTCTTAFAIKFLTGAAAIVSAIATVVAAIVAIVKGFRGVETSAWMWAGFAKQGLGLALSFLLLAVAFHLLLRVLVKKLGGAKIDILYLGWAGSAALAFGAAIASESWVGQLAENNVTDRTTIAAAIAAVAIGYFWVQILGATPRERKVVQSDALITAMLAIAVAVLFWAVGSAAFPLAIGILAWIGAWAIDKENKNRKF